MGFIGGKADRPAPISQAEADAILHRMEEGTDKPRPKTLFEPGEMVRVIDGPFNDFNGVVEEVNYDKSKLQVAVLIFGGITFVVTGVTPMQRLTENQHRVRTSVGAVADVAHQTGSGPQLARRESGHPEISSSLSRR